MAGVGTRLRAIGRDPALVVAGTIGVLCLVVPLVVLAALVATGNADDVGGLVVIAVFVLAGLWVLLDVAGRPVVEPAPEGRRSPLGLVVGTVVLLVVGALAFAVAGSLLGDRLQGSVLLARLVVSVAVLGVLVGVRWFVRRVLGVRRP